MCNRDCQIVTRHMVRSVSSLEDEREVENVLHPVPEIMLVTLCGVIAEAEGCEDNRRLWDIESGDFAGNAVLCLWRS